jgi:hypothetical protein
VLRGVERARLLLLLLLLPLLLLLLLAWCIRGQFRHNWPAAPAAVEAASGPAVGLLGWLHLPAGDLAAKAAGAGWVPV